MLINGHHEIVEDCGSLAIEVDGFTFPISKSLSDGFALMGGDKLEDFTLEDGQIIDAKFACDIA